MFGMHGSYPGHFAPASLKLKRSWMVVKGFGRYPGHFAPASLKHDEVCVLGVLAAALSGAFCSGLIEAGRQLRRRPDQSWLSGAFCSGLIEARD